MCRPGKYPIESVWIYERHSDMGKTPLGDIISLISDKQCVGDSRKNQER
jgi:hypothetical protein